MNSLAKHRYLFLLPVLGYLVSFVIFPTIYTWKMSFSTYGLGVNKFVGLKNYTYLASDSTFFEALLNTFYLVCAAVAIELVLGFAIALLLNRSFRGKALVFWFILLPMIVAPVVIGLAFRVLYDPTLGLINYLLELIGITGPEWLTTPNLAMPSIILIDVWQWTPFMVLLLMAGLQYIPKTVIEAARVDGATKLGLFRYVTLPLMKNLIVIAIIFRAMDCFNNTFAQIFMTTRGGPGHATETLPIYAYRTAFLFIKFGRAAAMSMVLFFVIAGFVTIVRRASREKLLQPI